MTHINSMLLTWLQEEKPWLKAKEARSPSPTSTAVSEVPTSDQIDPDDPNLTVPLPRYNAMLAVLRNTLYM